MKYSDATCILLSPEKRRGCKTIKGVNPPDPQPPPTHTDTCYYYTVNTVRGWDALTLGKDWLTITLLYIYFFIQICLQILLAVVFFFMVLYVISSSFLLSHSQQHTESVLWFWIMRAGVHHSSPHALGDHTVGGRRGFVWLVTQRCRWRHANSCSPPPVAAVQC